MDVTFTPLDPAGADRDALVALLTENAWPFHTRPRVTRPEAEKAVDGGAWEDEDHRTFWIEHPEHGRVGVVRLEDLTDPTPLFDLRVAERFRGRGLGAQILTALTRRVFETMPAVDRFEGQTREDNVPMLRTFRRAGWVKEAHYRRGWPVDGGEPLASVAYAMLRQDWASGTTTPVPADVDAPPPAGRKEGAAAGGRAPDWPLPTARLTLRPHREDDFGWLQEMYTQPEVVRHLLDEPWDEATARAKLAKRITWDDLGGPSGAASLVVEHAGVPVGDVILWLTDRERGVAEIGWALDPRHAGQGFAREAAAALLDLGFETSGLHRVVAQMDARNTASARLAETLGMRREAHHRQDLWSKGEWTDTLVYAMLASDRGGGGPSMTAKATSAPEEPPRTPWRKRNPPRAHRGEAWGCGDVNVRIHAHRGRRVGRNPCRRTDFYAHPMQLETVRGWTREAHQVCGPRSSRISRSRSHSSGRGVSGSTGS